MITRASLVLPRGVFSCLLTTSGRLLSTPSGVTPTPTPSGMTPTPTPSVTPDGATPTPTSQPTTPPPGRRVLSAGDFTYLGSYPIRGGDDVYGQGLTHRYVNGELRFLFLGFAGNNNPPNYYLPIEFSLPSQFGQPAIIRRDLGTWTSFWDPAYWSNNLCHTSIWWEEEENRIWSASGFDYPQGNVSTSETVALATRRLTSGGGAATDYSGFFGFENIGQRAVYGKVQRVPTWFKQKYNAGDYVSLSGGYTSLVAQGLGPALGPMFVFFPAPHGRYSARNGFGDPFNIPASDIKIGADTRSGTTPNDWYEEGYANRSKDRGVRVTFVENYYDGGDPRPNPPSRPTDPPLASAGWLSPPTRTVPGDPDGFGRWVWGDSYHDTGNWIDNHEGTRLRHGIVMVASLAKGKAYYSLSSLHADAGALEIHVYDPADVASVIGGNLAAYKIRPVTVFALNELEGILAPQASVGATFDARTNKLYILTYFASGAINRIHEYSVATGE